MTLGETILSYRKEKQMTQQQCADLIGVTRQTISNWELDETSPNASQLMALASIFDVHVQDLLGETYKEKNNHKDFMKIKQLTMVIVFLMVLVVLLLIIFVIST